MLNDYFTQSIKNNNVNMDVIIKDEDDEEQKINDGK